MNDVLLAAALAYAARAIPVVPLHTPAGPQRCSCNRSCDSIGKHPRLLHGLRDATTDAGQIRSWWRTWPHANIGLVTGVVMDVCDIDTQEGLAALLELLGDQALTGPSVATGSGGWHSWLATTGLGNRVGLLPGVDWRGRGGYVVAPPSLHASGRRYRWNRPLATALPPCPPALRRQVEGPNAQPELGEPVGTAVTPAAPPTQAEGAGWSWRTTRDRSGLRPRCPTPFSATGLRRECGFRTPSVKSGPGHTEHHAKGA